MQRAPGFVRAVCVMALGLAIIAGPAHAANEVKIPGGEIRKQDPNAKNATIKTFGPVSLASLKASLKQSGPIRAYLEGVSFKDEAVEIQVFLHEGKDIDYKNYLGSIGNVSMGHEHGGTLTLTFEVKDFKTTDNKGHVLAQGKPRSALANADKVSLTLICKEGGMTFTQLRITDQIEQ